MNSENLNTQLSEIQKLKAQNHLLMVKNYHLESQVVQNNLIQQRGRLGEQEKALIEEFKISLSPVENSTFNWSTLTFEPPALKDKE